MAASAKSVTSFVSTPNWLLDAQFSFHFIDLSLFIYLSGQTREFELVRVNIKTGSVDVR